MPTLAAAQPCLARQASVVPQRRPRHAVPDRGAGAPSRAALFLPKRLELAPEPAGHEARVSGYDLHRQITGLGVACAVIAPALTPRRPGQRIKTDRRDAAKLVRLFRAGELTAIHVLDESEEAVRDLVRCRD